MNPVLKALVRGDQEENREVQVGGGGDEVGGDEVGGEGVEDEVGANEAQRYLRCKKNSVTAVYASFTLHEHITLHYVTNRLFRLQCNVHHVTQNKPLSTITNCDTISQK